jgi:hypothetical protein
MKHKIEMAPLADYYVVAVKDIISGELIDSFTLNDSAADMLRLFCEDKTPEMVATEMAQMYEAPVEIVSKDVMAFAERLKQKGLL